MENTNDVELGIQLWVNEKYLSKDQVTVEMIDCYESILKPVLPDKEVKIIDVGSGVSFYFKDLLDSGYLNITALDETKFKLNELMFKLDEEKKNRDKVIFLVADFLTENLIFWPKYDVVIFSQLFHFFEFDKVKEIISEINPQLKDGTIIQVRVHSEKHPANGNPATDNFQSFYTFKMLNELFPPEDFEAIIEADVVKEKSTEAMEKLKDKARNYYRHTEDQDEFKKQVDDYMKLNNPNAYLHYVIKKKGK
jgi:hypothetical protein